MLRHLDYLIRKQQKKAAKDNNTVTEADRQAAKDKTETKTDSKENESVDEKIKRLFGKDGALSKGLTEMAKTSPQPQQQTLLVAR